MSTAAEEAVVEAAHLAAAMSSLSRRDATRVGKAIGWVMIANTAYGAARKVRSLHQAQQSYRISVPSTDDIFADLNAWLLQRLTPADRRALTAQSFRNTRYDDRPLGVGEGEPAPKLQLFYDSRQPQTIVVEGHRIRVSLDEPPTSIDLDKPSNRWGRKERIVFECRGEQARDALVAVLKQLVEKLATTRPPRVFVARRWGGFDMCDDTPSRPVESVVLAAGQKEKLLADIGDFLASEQQYINLGIPYHRSYLLHGVPGTGKTSVAKAAAFHFGLDLRYVPLSMMENDQSLMETLANLGSRSVLLLEDIDIAHAARERDDTQRGVTLSGLLNGLDGVVTPHGLITFMTTNKVDALDEALIRPGRVDLSLNLGYVDDDQLCRLAAVMGYPVDRLALHGRLITPAQVVGVFKANLGDPPAATHALAELIDMSPANATSTEEN